MVRTLTCLAALVFLLAPNPLRADVPPSQGVSFEQKLNAQVPLDCSFRDETGQTVRLGDYFTDKPVILVLAYYRCPQLCTQVLNGLVQAILEIDAKPNKDYRILTVSFDARETPKLAAAKKRVYVEERYGRPGGVEAWHFLTGDEKSIKSLTDAVGFHFRYDPKFDQFAHASGIMVLTPQGRVSRYLYGIEYNPRDLELSLVEASSNKIGTPTDYFLLLCFLHYDETLGKYTPAVLKMVRVGGVLTVLGIVLMVGLMLRSERRQAHMAHEPETPAPPPEDS